MPPELVIVGVGRRAKTDEQFRADVRQALAKFRPDAAAQPDIVQRFLAASTTTAPISASWKGWPAAADVDLEKEHQLPGNRLFYLATDPISSPHRRCLSAAGLSAEADGKPGNAWSSRSRSAAT